jgi:hypothetical protein
MVTVFLFYGFPSNDTTRHRQRNVVWFVIKHHITIRIMQGSRRRRRHPTKQGSNSDEDHNDSAAKSVINNDPLEQHSDQNHTRCSSGTSNSTSRYATHSLRSLSIERNCHSSHGMQSSLNSVSSLLPHRGDYSLLRQRHNVAASTNALWFHSAHLFTPNVLLLCSYIGVIWTSLTAVLLAIYLLDMDWSLLANVERTSRLSSKSLQDVRVYGYRIAFAPSTFWETPSSSSSSFIATKSPHHWLMLPVVFSSTEQTL